MRLLFVTAALAMLAGCGYPGPPQPPALYVPVAITDFDSEVNGDQIVVHFTTPALTGERLPVTKLNAIELLIGPSEVDSSREKWASTAHRYAIPADELGLITHTLPASEWAGQQVVLAVRTTGQSGRKSDFSNLDVLAVGPPLAKPRFEAPKATAKGVALAWSGDAPRYRVLRASLADAEPKLETAGESDTREYVDGDADFGVRYRYVVVGFSGESQQSLPSDPVEIQPIDTFPPSVPAGLAAVAGVASIDLSWGLNTDNDLEGNNVYRAVDDGMFALYATKVTVPAFTDSKVEAGKRYRYAISAIDKTGNESMRSAEVTAVIQ